MRSEVPHEFGKHVCSAPATSVRWDEADPGWAVGTADARPSGKRSSGTWGEAADWRRVEAAAVTSSIGSICCGGDDASPRDSRRILAARAGTGGDIGCTAYHKTTYGFQGRILICVCDAEKTLALQIPDKLITAHLECNCLCKVAAKVVYLNGPAIMSDDKLQPFTQAASLHFGKDRGG